MHQQTGLKGLLRACRGGYSHPRLIIILLLIVVCAILFVGSGTTAQADDAAVVENQPAENHEAQAARRRKADDLLQSASLHIQDQRYDLAAETLQKCRDLEPDLSKGQRRNLEKYSERSEAGQAAISTAANNMAAAAEQLDQNQAAKAHELLSQAYSLRHYLPEETTDQLKERLESAKKQLAQQKASLKKLFKASVKQYRKDQFAEARTGFQEIQDSGVELGFFDRGGDLTSVNGYLGKIAKKMGTTTDEADPEEAVARADQMSDTSDGASQAEESGQSTDGVDDAAELTDAAAPAGALRATAPAQADEASSDAPKKRGFSIWPFREKEPEPLSEETLQQIERRIAMGEQAMLKGKYELAKEHYREALALNPENDRAQQGSTAAEYHISTPTVPGEGPRTSLIDAIRTRDQIHIQFVEGSLASARAEIDQMIVETLFARARARASEVLANVEGAKQVLGPRRYQQLHDQATALLDRIDRSQKEHGKAELDKKITEAQKRQSEQEMRHGAARAAKVSQLYTQAIAFGDQRQYDQAVVTLEELLRLEPGHGNAQTMVRLMEDLQSFAEQRELDRKVRTEEKKVILDAVESAIPWSGYMSFGEDDEWVRLTERRGKAEARREYSGSPQKRATLEKLDETLLDLDYTDVEFGQVLDELRAETGLNIFPSWGDLELAGIYPDDTVTLQLVQVPARAALTRALEAVSGGKLDRAGYIVDEDGVVSVNSVGILGATYDFYTKVYYVADLVEQGLGEGVSTDVGEGTGDSDYTDEDTQEAEERVGTLIELILTTVKPNSWDPDLSIEGVDVNLDSGTDDTEGHATVNVHNQTNLVVYQTRDAHRQIDNLLSQLRENLGEQVSIEARFLVINNNFLEDIGLDIDFFLNLGNAGFDQTGNTDPIYGRQILNPRANPGPWNRTTPITMQQDSFSHAATGGTGIPGSLGGGIAPSAFLVSGSFLDNVQVDFLMRATQAHNRSHSLTAPHMTVRNGSHASLFFGTERNYIHTFSDDEAPEVEQLELGTSLNLTPTISADKRFVNLDIYISNSELIEMLTITYQEGQTGGTEFEGVPTRTLQEPQVAKNRIRTRVSVPDGGTLLLGGQKLAGEVEREMGVPMLSKIPILNRLFSNRSIVKDESVLLVLIKPKIIIQSEEEDLRFGSLVDRD